MSWLDLVPISLNTYAYHGHLLCEGCARKIMRTLSAGNAVDNGDSDTWPQGPLQDGGGGADSACFCGNDRSCVNAVAIVPKHKIGCPLGNPLTKDGSQTVTETVVRDLLSKPQFVRKVGRLIRHVWRSEISSTPMRVPPLYTDNLPESLSRLCKKRHKSATIASAGLRTGGSTSRLGFDSRIYADLDNAYLVYHRPSVTELIRASTNDEGDFVRLQVAQLPPAAVEGVTLDAVLTAAVSEGAWD